MQAATSKRNCANASFAYWKAMSWQRTRSSLKPFCLPALLCPTHGGPMTRPLRYPASAALVTGHGH
eukprot:14406264-Alexandrium_andersonii.AAC.1